MFAHWNRTYRVYYKRDVAGAQVLSIKQCGACSVLTVVRSVRAAGMFMTPQRLALQMRTSASPSSNPLTPTPPGLLRELALVAVQPAGAFYLRPVLHLPLLDPPLCSQGCIPGT